jgi:signal transduction histidine kinase
MGLRSMRERAEELGGRLVTGPGLGGRGTTVELWLPMEAT